MKSLEEYAKEIIEICQAESRELEAPILKQLKSLVGEVVELMLNGTIKLCEKEDMVKGIIEELTKEEEEPPITEIDELLKENNNGE